MTTSVDKKRTANWRLIYLVLFFLVCGLISLPCLCLEGEIKGRFTMGLFSLISLRFICDLKQQKMKLYDYILYSSIQIGFVVWTKYL